MIGLYHPNGKGTGSAITIDTESGSTYNYVHLKLARQKTVAMRTADGETFPTFDWEHQTEVHLKIVDVAEMLQVFRGCQESIADGKGLFMRDANGHAIVKLEHRIEPVHGYVLEVSSKAEGSDETEKTHFFFRTTEAFAVALALEQSMGKLAFGDAT